jgi:hypothetical protein
LLILIYETAQCGEEDSEGRSVRLPSRTYKMSIGSRIALSSSQV